MICKFARLAKDTVSLFWINKSILSWTQCNSLKCFMQLEALFESANSSFTQSLLHEVVINSTHEASSNT